MDFTINECDSNQVFTKIKLQELNLRKSIVSFTCDIKYISLTKSTEKGHSENLDGD
jgi:hypothetical protein